MDHIEDQNALVKIVALPHNFSGTEGGKIPQKFDKILGHYFFHTFGLIINNQQVSEANFISLQTNKLHVGQVDKIFSEVEIKTIIKDLAEEEIKFTSLNQGLVRIKVYITKEEFQKTAEKIKNSLNELVGYKVEKNQLNKF